MAGGLFGSPPKSEPGIFFCLEKEARVIATILNRDDMNQMIYSMPHSICTGCVVLCLLWLNCVFLAESFNLFTQIFQGRFTDTGTIICFPCCQWSNHERYEQNPLVAIHHKAQPSMKHVHNFGIMMTSSNGNIFRGTGPLCGEFTGYRWIPLTKASDAELWCFFLSAPE